jgi:hypothetical protein
MARYRDGQVLMNRYGDGEVPRWVGKEQSWGVDGIDG